ncbi:MAG: ABC transporter substrate-binding protein [Rhodospirillales bacterium]|jgi:branched-chain amino acid transport system substrate-binding protein|nr:ABC transporter substrate-binding protein [Rhodospirillales bacterium]
MTRHFIKRTLAILLTAAAALAFGAPGAPASETIRIGTFLSVTGPASFLGDPELKTLRMYIESINKDGGVLGRKLELVHYDVQHLADKAKTAIKRLIEDDKVDVIIGPSTTGTTMATIPLVERAGIPMISLAGAVVIINPVKKWVFKTPHTDRMACAKIFGDMKKRGFTRIGMISGTGGFGKSMRGQCKGLAADFGISVLADETYGPKDSDMTPQLTKIKNTKGLQAVLNPGFGQGPAIVTKNFRQLGMGMSLYQSHGVASKKYIELAGAAAEGVRLPAAALLVADQLADNDPQKVVVVGYKKAFEKRWGSAVSTFGGHAYDGLQLAISAIARAGSTDKEKVRAEIEKTSGYIGTGGIVHMSPDDHLGLSLSAFRMLEIKNGEWTLVD